MKIDRRFKKRFQAHFERLELQAGVLQDKPHYAALPAKRGLNAFAGGPARKKSRFKSNQSVAQVAEQLRTVHRVPYLTQPFEKNTRERRQMMKAFGALITGKTRSFADLREAILKLIQTPILKQRYGRNTPKTVKTKTFNRFLIDTGQFFRALSARVRRRRVSK